MSTPAQRPAGRARWLLLACALWGCGPAAEDGGPDWAERTSPVALPLTCPRGVSACSGAGAQQVGWAPVLSSGTGRVEAAQVFAAPGRGWPGVARLVLRRESPVSTQSLPQGVVEVRAASGQQLPGTAPVARGTFDLKSLPCAGTQGTCDGPATVLDVPLLPVRGASPLLPGSASRPQWYVLTLSLDGPGAARLGVALHRESTGTRLFEGSSSRPAHSAAWGATRWTPRGESVGVFAFALTLEWDRVPGCADTERNGEETGVDCGGGCAPCPPGKGCAVDADCQAGATCRQGLCAALGSPGAPCSRALECSSGLCGAAGACRPATCANGKKDGTEKDVDCGGSCDGCEAGVSCGKGADCSSGRCSGTPATCQPSGCNDGVRAAGETDVDCGGDCAPCAQGKRCMLNGDCASAACIRGTCQTASCRDGVLNGSEADVDCGGGACRACAAGKGCSANTDCASGVCTNGTCAVPSCTDGVKNGVEVDVDCGGPCPLCSPGQACTAGTHCSSRVCSVTRSCTNSTCQDRVFNGLETDVDCGGGCRPCAATKGCAADADCQSGACTAGKCELAACTDGVKGRQETDVDCGGPCRARCTAGRGCKVHADCATGVCAGRTCVPGTCTDKRRTDDETDVDCGGTTCGRCGLGLRCAGHGDCASLTCVGGRCRVASCSDGLRNGTETAADCGGACAPCAAGSGCLLSSDCGSQVCSAGMCQAPTGTDGVRNGAESDVDCGGNEVPSRCAPGRRCSTTKDCYRNAACLQNLCVCPPGVVCTNAPAVARPSKNASCQAFGTATACTCLPGYAGDGYSCTDRDECADGTLSCPADEVCVNQPGTARCDCRPGYARSGNACVDVDECAAAPCDVNASCINTDGGFSCTCNGPDWVGDGGTCEPFNTAPGVANVVLPAKVTRSNSVSASAGATWDAEGDPVTLEWEWKVDGVVVPGATRPGISPPLFSRGQLLTVTVTPFDGRLRGTPVSASVVVSNATPPIPVVSFGNAYVPGQPLDCVATSAASDADGDPVTHRFIWTVNGVTAPGVTLGSHSSQLPGAYTEDGGWISCQADPYDGLEYGNGSGGIQLFFQSPCTWTEFARWPLDELPNGAQTRNGAYVGQGLLSVGGRTAWTQRSDWNQLFVPSPALATDDILAASVDVQWSAGSRVSVGQRTQTAGYNDVIKGYEFLHYLGTQQATVTAFAPTSNRSICCSTPITNLGTASVASFAADTWHTLRVEHRESTQRVKGMLDGVPSLSVTGTLNWGGTSIKLDSGRPCCSSGYVAFSQLRLERGTVGCFKGNRAPCTSNSECASGYCVSGVCCSSACTGANQTCTRSGSIGTCVTQ